jgi:DNA processing protein
VQDTDPHTASSLDAQAVHDWIRLTQASGVGCRTAGSLLQLFGSPAAIFRAGYTALAAHVPAAQAAALCAAPSPDTVCQIEAALAWLREPAHGLLTLHDAGYPALLRHIPDPPLLLYIKGRRALLTAPMIAVVGSRNAGAQGRANAQAFALALSQAGLCVVSGMALGIDTAAHEGALGGPGSTAAVIGTGPDRVYPARNRALAHRIAEQGCIVSEYALGMPALASNFPRRNRIISGMTAGVLVVEAAARSGSLITAQLAAEQGREVFALPGSIHSALAKGCHQLIREGAHLVETVDEVLDALRMSPLVRLGAPAAAASDNALLAALGHDPVAPDELLARTGGDAAALAVELLALELAGQVERLPGGALQRVVRTMRPAWASEKKDML